MEYRNARYTEFGTIDCEINHPVYGWIPFTASPDDVEPHGREMFAEIQSRGNPAPFVPRVPTYEEAAASVRSTRDSLLAASDWTQLPDVPEETRLAWATYRQALRDVPQQAGFPYQVVWPSKP